MKDPRTLTLTVMITDSEKAKWIWENHLRGLHQPQAEGIKVIGIDEGETSSSRFDEENCLDHHSCCVHFEDSP